MSFATMDQVVSPKPKAVSNTKLAKIVAAALRQDLGEKQSTIKEIGQRTGASLSTIKKWYEARNAPSAGHLLLLARSSPALLQFILEQIGGEDLWDAYQLLGRKIINSKREDKSRLRSGIYSDNSVTIKVSVDPADAGDLNQRQLWFLGRLQISEKTKADDIVRIWHVDQRTARRDIAFLTAQKLICFTGAKKTGYYIALKKRG